MTHSTARYIYTFLLVAVATLIPFFAIPQSVPVPDYAFEKDGDLMRDLWLVDCINATINDRLPVMYNHDFQGGYVNMPSARVGCEGEVGAGISWVPPYRNYNIRIQALDRLEISGNYRIFRGVDDAILSKHGFGDFSDKGANVKLVVVHPEDSNYDLPGVAIGCIDFMGTRAFAAEYIVLTQVLIDYNLELSLGYGKKRLHRFFGGGMWMPFRKSDWCFLNPLALTAEYDPIDYTNPRFEHHPDGRVKKSSINYGIKYRLMDCVDLSYSRVRGVANAGSVSFSYNLGESEGVPKVDDSLLYRCPMISQPIGLLRPEEAMVHDFLYALDEQAFILLEAWIEGDPRDCQTLRLKMYTNKYRKECEIRERITNLLAFLTPSNISEVIAVIDASGFPTHEYHFDVAQLTRFRKGCVGDYELALLSPMCEVSYPDTCSDTLLFARPRDSYTLYAEPSYQSMFGSAKGKYKFTLGVDFGIEGYLWNELFYSVAFNQKVYSTIKKLGSKDMLNPSQLINVQSDRVCYTQATDFALMEAFIEKCWNMGCGWYSRFAGGYFNRYFGGIGGEFLYYPVETNWAVGVEGAYLRKRDFRGFSFTPRIRQLVGFKPTYHKYQIWQGFVNFYYYWSPACLDFKVSAGHFLAGDLGARIEVSKYFSNGLKVYAWYTQTNGNDVINGKIYHDKGVGISIPLDYFLTRQSRRRWSYGMSAWLRDVGAQSSSGRELFTLIHREREE